MFLSIVIPAYNEEKRLSITLEKVYSYLAGIRYDYEVIIVDDGSADTTSEVALKSQLNRAGRLQVIKNECNKGKGFSVKRGVLASRGEYVLFSDADLSTPIEELEKLLAIIRSGFDIAIGSRSISGAQVKVHQPFYREFMGRFFNFLVKLIALKGFVDTQCGFKLFKSNAIKDIAASLVIEGFGFDVEILYLAVKKGYKIKEVPIIWINSPTSRVNPLLDSCKMVTEILSIKRLHG